ncbi:MAG: antibiotic biosynthesis monooxygenase [Gemmataceae bacterium]|nr:antibiotic biosynthesis monooxygenase [Gemmataceae bacterium]
MLIRIMPLLILAMVLIVPVSGQEKENSLFTEVKANLKDPTKRFTMIVSVKVKADAGAKLEAAFAKARVETLKEKGCLVYEMNRDAKAGGEYIVYERWQNLAALDFHLKAAHTQTLLTTIGDLLVGPPSVKVYIPAGE